MAYHARPRILILAEWFPSPGQPGRAPWAREHARAVARYANVVVVAPDEGDVPLWRIEVTDGDEDGLRVVRARYRSLGGYRRTYPLRVLAIAKALRHIESTGFHADLVHAHVFYAGFAALILARGRGLPVVVSEHYTAFPRGLVTGVGKWMAKTTFERAALVCPASESLERDIRALGIGGRFRVMPNVVDTEVFRPPHRRRQRDDGRPIRLLNVASLDPKKGHLDLLEALVLARDRYDTEFELEIIGTGVLGPQLEETAARLGLGPHVRFEGGKSKHEVAAAMRKADALVLSSHAENAPLAIAEALVCGLPVVATGVGGVPEMLSNTDSHLVPPHDPGALADAIVAISREPLRPDPARAVARWGHESVGRLWADLYVEEIARRCRRRSSAP